jgi:Holliday junction resolvasome RuvABC endonuclease subunit
MPLRYDARSARCSRAKRRACFKSAGTITSASMTPPCHPRRSIVLAVKPSHRGFGWAGFEAPFSLCDWGLEEQRRPTNQARSLAALEKLLARLMPEVLMLEASERTGAKRTTSTERLSHAMAKLASERGVTVESYTRGDVRACFAAVGARTRDQIAAAVASYLPVLRPRLPKPRRQWEGEDRRMALFCAAALALTHYQAGADQVFNDLRLDP